MNKNTISKGIIVKISREILGIAMATKGMKRRDQQGAVSFVAETTIQISVLVRAHLVKKHTLPYHLSKLSFNREFMPHRITV